MYLSHRVSSIVAFLRAGHPAWMPATGHIPLLALLRRRVTDDEITDIASELILSGHSPIDNVDRRRACPGANCCGRAPGHSLG
jgi:Protein of unknown function (DUF3349)